MLSMQARGSSIVGSRLLLVGVMAWAIVLGGCTVTPGMAPLLEREVGQELAWQPGSAVHVQTGNGGIEVVRGEPGSATARIEATLFSESQERLDAATLSARFTDEGAFDVRVEWPDGRAESREGARMLVIVPDADGLRLTTTNGVITTEGLAGEAVLRASNGSITIYRHKGTVRCTTTNGRIRVEECVGDVELRSSNGSITLRDATGPVQVTTTNGRAAVSLADDNVGPVMLRTSNGDATLRVGPGFVGELVLQTGNGGIDTNLRGLNASVIEMDKRNRRVLRFGEVGESTPDSSVRTTNGEIEVSKR